MKPKPRVNNAEDLKFEYITIGTSPSLDGDVVPSVPSVDGTSQSKRK